MTWGRDNTGVFFWFPCVLKYKRGDLDKVHFEFGLPHFVFRFSNKLENPDKVRVGVGPPRFF